MAQPAGAPSLIEYLRNQSLRTKVIGVFLVPTLAIVLLYGLLAYFAANRGLENELGERLKSVGQAVSADLSDGFDAQLIRRLDASKNRVRERLRKRLRRTREKTGLQELYLFDRDLESLIDSHGEREFGEKIYKLQANRYEIERSFEEAEATTSVLFEGDDGRLYKSAYVPITHEGEVVALLGVEASPEYFGLLRNFATALTGLGAVGLALVVLAGALFARALTRPVHQLVEAARRLGEGKLEEPVVELPDDEEEPEPRDEIVVFARVFEEMRRDILQRDRQMKMMLSGIAHEVRNPLGGMELFCGLLREDLEEVGDEEALEKVDRIEREVDYLDRVVEEFRDFAEDSALEWERFSAAELVREIQNLVRADLEEAGCELEVEVDPSVELTADRDRLRRVLHNLVRNAYQACGEGDAIEVEVEAPSERKRRIVVRDDGPGIPEEAQEDLFTPFFTTKEKGSGLGLSLSDKIVEKHGGTLTIDTEEGEGTEATVDIPFDPDVESDASAGREDWLG